MLRDPHEQNRRSWNLATRAHNSHKADQAGFLRAGGSTLFPDELELLGVPPAFWPKEHVPEGMSGTTGGPPPLAGLELVHMLCNSGQDTLSLARLGATVTGVDISDEAIAFAGALARDSGVAGRFVRSDVYAWLTAANAAGERYDVAFASYGALPWLSDLTRWACGVAEVLRPGGRLVVLEFHPVASVFDEQLRPTFPYFSAGAPLVNADGIGDYVGAAAGGLSPSGFQPGDAAFRNPEPCYEFLRGLGEIVTAIARAGLVLEQLREYPYTNGCKYYDEMRPLPGRRWALPEGLPAMPLMYGLTARKPA